VRGWLSRWIAIAMVLFACTRSNGTETPKTADIVRVEIDKAEAAEKQRQHLVAREHYEKAVAEAKRIGDPSGIGFATREFGETLATWGENEEARAQLEIAVVNVPNDPIAWQMLGILRHKLGDIPGAFLALEKSKALAPRAWIPRRDLAVLHWSRGEGRTADPDPTKAAEHRAAALAEYQAMLDLELPDRLREKVEWAIGVLSKQR
jgi:tetratricopeptide (TPR) repeat protein